MNSLGLDFLGRHGWRSAITSRQATPSRENVQIHIPTALLPIKKQENLLAGRDVENHRRGRVLPWPPEAQVPVLGRPENGSGRVPFAALFEQIAKAETTWGRLDECRFAWRPEGTQKIEVDASKLIAHHVNQAAQECPIVGLVVPDSLGIAGQQALISACFGKQAILVPKTVAVALAWCNRAKQDGLISARRELFIGHLTVVDMAFGSWSVSKIPLFAAKHNGLFWIQPVHFPNLKRTKLTTTGLSILSTALNGSDLAMLKLGWARDILSGVASLPGIRSSSNTRQKSSLASLQSLVGNGDLNLAFREVFQAMQDIALGPEYGQCLRLLLTGPLATIRVEREPMSALFKSRVNSQTEESPETDAVDGAAWAAHGMATGTPTWLEMIEPLDIYYIGKNELGDADHAWLPVLETKLIQAGVEYRNPEPIGGLKLQSGHSYNLTFASPYRHMLVGKQLISCLKDLPRKCCACLPCLKQDIPAGNFGLLALAIGALWP
jgi:hypothetical protein